MRAVNVFLVRAPVKSMNLVMASLKEISPPVGNGCFGGLPLYSKFLVKQNSWFKSRECCLANSSTDAGLLTG